MNYCFRKCKLDDYNFIYDLKEKCFRWYIEKIYGWDDEFQKTALHNEMNKLIDYMNIIQSDDIDIGLFTYYVDENGDGCIGMFAILPDYQQRGIGTNILMNKLHENKEKGVRTYLKTYKENPARILYQRVGFKEYDVTETHLLMEVND